MLSKKVIFTFSIISAIGLVLIAFAYFHPKAIETVSASVSVPSEQIFAPADGILKSINVEDYADVKVGDVIAQIEVTLAAAKCQDKKTSETIQQKAVKDYENAAIMYKDGIITQEQYDKSLENLRAVQAKKPCSAEAKQTENILALKNGKAVIGSYKVGDSISEGDLVAEVYTDKPQIHAYFSPKQVKNLPVGADSEISIIKYPEKHLTGVVKALDTVDIMGRLVVIDINGDTSDMILKNGDAATVKIKK